MDAETFAVVQRVLAEPKRIEILEAIRRLDTDQGVACNVVLDSVGISQSTFSHHVSELSRANLIEARKEGRCSLLSVNKPALETYLQELQRKFLG